MPYISREDGERFVIPSYRDILSAKKKTVLKQEILLLSENYGPFAVLQKKNAQQYEIAFSQDPGYLLGETVWHYLKRPFDLVYCESIPDTNEAMLVVVRGGSVYLDGTFPIDGLSDELVTLLTQKNNYEIYISGDVPISQVPTPGKFSFDPSQVKSFNVLPAPIFPKLPKLKAFQLRLVDTVLKAHGIGVFPLKQLVAILILIGLGWMGWNYLTTHKKEVPQVFQVVSNPYQGYITELSTPSPSSEINMLNRELMLLAKMPGWMANSVEYSNGNARISVKSLGADSQNLLKWAKQNNFIVEIASDGFYLNSALQLSNRLPPKDIHHLDEVIASLIDRMTLVLPGNNFSISQTVVKGPFKEVVFSISFKDISIITLDLIAKQLVGLPLNLQRISITFPRGYITGTITLTALGN